MSGSKAVEKAATPQVPALVNTPTSAMEIDAADVQLPRIRIAQGLSGAVTEQLVKFGALYSSVGKEDPEPVQLAEANSEESIVIHVLGLRKGKSRHNKETNELETWDFNDPNAHPDARTTYDYTVSLPEVDPEVPHKFLLKGTSTAAARLINTVLSKAGGVLPRPDLAFRITVVTRKNAQGQAYGVARAQHVDAVEANVEAAAALASLVAAAPSSSAVEQSNGNAPAI